MKARFLPAAEAELLKETEYYSIAREGLGIKFAREVERAVRMAVSNPDGGMPFSKGTRRRLVKGFPFSLVYRLSDSEILIIALMHHRKRPGYWADRIE
jgi:toxin ParE1/3/4